MQQEVQSMKIWQFESFYFSFNHLAEMPFDGFRSHLADQQRIVLVLQGDDADVCRVPFVTGAGVRKFYKLDLHFLLVNSMTNFANQIPTKARKTIGMYQTL